MMTSASSTSRFLQRSIQGLLKDNRKSCCTNIAVKEMEEPKFSSHSGDANKSTNKFGTREFEEIKLNVPWGHISAKWYGPKDIRPIVGFHGWQDNAGTFDTIAPLLPAHIGFLTVDLPGHGLSSWLPDGCKYHAMDYITLMFTLMNEFKWDKISMICHSMSSINGFTFCSLFPDKCDMLIGLDIIKPVVQPKEVVIQRIAERLENFNKADARNRSKNEPPCYDFEELVERLYEGSEKSIEKECCEFILKRNVKPSAQDLSKYYFSRDSRLKNLMLHDLPQDVVVEMAKRITCPHLFIKALQGPYYESKRHYYEALKVLQEKPTFEYHEVEGKHHVHLNEPKKIADIINPFIMKHRPE